MNADRPDQTEETHVVGKGRFQWESGLLYNDFDTGRSALMAAFLHEIGSNWKIAYNGGFQQEAFEPDMAWQVNGSVHYKAAEKAELFAGYFSQFQSNEAPFHNIDAGINYKLKESIQIDLAAGSSIWYDEPNRFLTIGFSIAIPQ
jgi:hypothetical protein